MYLFAALTSPRARDASAPAAARASGVGLDTRRNFPSEPYQGFTLGVSGSGDVYSRAYVRWLEIQKSVFQ